MIESRKGAGTTKEKQPGRKEVKLVDQSASERKKEALLVSSTQACGFMLGSGCRGACHGRTIGEFALQSYRHDFCIAWAHAFHPVHGRELMATNCA